MKYETKRNIIIVAVVVAVALVASVLVLNKPVKHVKQTNDVGIAQPAAWPVPLMSFQLPTPTDRERARVDHHKKVTRNIGYPRVPSEILYVKGEPRRVNGGCYGKETVNFAINAYQQELYRTVTTVHACWATRAAPGNITYFSYNRYWDKGDITGWINPWSLDHYEPIVAGSGIGGLGWEYRYRRSTANMHACFLGACIYNDRPWNAQTVRANGSYEDSIGG